MLLHAFTVEKAEAHLALAAFLRAKLDQPWSKVKELIASGVVRVASRPNTDAGVKLQVGQRVEIVSPERKERIVRTTTSVKRPKTEKAGYQGPTPTVTYLDDAVIVVDKPAGITTMRHAEEAAEFGERGRHYLPITLADLVPKLIGLPGKPPRSVHRIDRDTSGLVVFARTAQAEARLTEQFKGHTIARRYVAFTRGVPKAGRIESLLVRDRGDGRRGAGEGGLKAVSFVKLIETVGDYGIVECRLETGRTHQVRIHLGEVGTPICGERIYDRPTIHGPAVPDGSGADRPMLHAAVLGFDHPESGERMEWRSPLPDDMKAVLQRLRLSAGPPSAP